VKGHPFIWLPVAKGLFILVGIAFVGLNLLTARSLRSRKRHALCLLSSAVNCAHFPLGTLLGAFTITVLYRPAVRAALELPGGSDRPPHSAALRRFPGLHCGHRQRLNPRSPPFYVQITGPVHRFSIIVREF
jgi:hypothetical protein